MTLPLEFRAEVRADVDSAYQWYEDQRSGLGEEFLAALDGAFDQIRRWPELSGKVLRDVRCTLTRRFPFGVFYRVEEHRTLILAVMHHHRHPHRWKSRR